MGRPVVHWELMSKEPARVADFYAKISLFTDPEGRMMGLWRANAA